MRFQEITLVKIFSLPTFIARPHFLNFLVEAIEKAVDDVAKFDAGTSPKSRPFCISCIALIITILDDWFVIAITDANFGRYEITADDLKRSLYRNPKVHTALICIGEGAEATW